MTDTRLSVSDAIARRRSTRAFLPTPVDMGLLRRLADQALRAPSNSNIQPWHVHLVGGAALERLRVAAAARAVVPPAFDERAFKIYPEPLDAPYGQRRFECGERQYGALGIARDDHEGRLRYVYGNHQFFGAPAGLFLFIDRAMAEPSQWADLGIYLQTLLLLLTEAGLDSIAQISWTLIASTVRQELGIADHLTLYCGVSIGHADPDAAVNRIVADRAAFDDIVTVHAD